MEASNQKFNSLECDGNGGSSERAKDGIGGTISTYQSIATLYEVGFNHFFVARRMIFQAI